MAELDVTFVINDRGTTVVTGGPGDVDRALAHSGMSEERRGRVRDALRAAAKEFDNAMAGIQPLKPHEQTAIHLSQINSTLMRIASSLDVLVMRTKVEQSVSESPRVHS